MPLKPWMKWYPADWRSDPKLRMCCASARGIWADMLALMHEAAPYGHLLVNAIAPNAKQLASLIGTPEREVASAVAELRAAGVFSETDGGVIYSRRMVRDEARADRDGTSGAKGGNPDLLRGTVPKDQRSRPFKRTDAPVKTARIFDACGGQCHWCRVVLTTEIGTGDLPANFFHVDHLTAIRDGGTNDEINLVAACASCNHDRARQEVSPADECSCRKAVGLISDHNPDIKAQKLEARDQKLERKRRAKDALSAEEQAEFDQWWPHYPHKAGKAEAGPAFAAARRKATLEDLIDGAKRYALVLAKPNAPSPKFPQGWLNGERWKDEIANPSAAPASTAALSPDEIRADHLAHFIKTGNFYGSALDRPTSKEAAQAELSRLTPRDGKAAA